MSQSRDRLTLTVAPEAVQVRARAVLSGWRCACAELCMCSVYRSLLQMCGAGKALFPTQHETIELLLQRGDK